MGGKNFIKWSGRGRRRLFKGKRSKIFENVRKLTKTVWKYSKVVWKRLKKFDNFGRHEDTKPRRKINHRFHG